MINVGSICTGYGGIELALNLAGVDHRLQWVSEIDPTASAVVADHWPHVPNLGDINDATPAPVDLITAGFPCQDISVAGQQAGIHGQRSGLWWRIRDVVGDLRPQWVLLENVAAITTNGGPAVVASLTELGYDSRWGIVRASDAGAPHQRARWFCLATNTRSVGWDGRQQTSQRRPAGTQRDSGGPTTDQRPATDTGGMGRRPRARPGASEPARQWRHGLSDNGGATATDPDGKRRVRFGVGWLPANSDPYTWRDLDGCNGARVFGTYAKAVHRWEQLTRPAPPPTTDSRLNPRFVEWMMGLPDQWVNHGSRAAQLRCLGNGVVPQQAALAIRLLETT